jgi:hypothetical protein
MLFIWSEWNKHIVHLFYLWKHKKDFNKIWDWSALLRAVTRIQFLFIRNQYNSHFNNIQFKLHLSCGMWKKRLLIIIVLRYLCQMMCNKDCKVHAHSQRIWMILLQFRQIKVLRHTNLLHYTVSWDHLEHQTQLRLLWTGRTIQRTWWHGIVQNHGNIPTAKVNTWQEVYINSICTHHIPQFWHLHYWFQGANRLLIVTNTKKVLIISYVSYVHATSETIIKIVYRHLKRVITKYILENLLDAIIHTHTYRLYGTEH